MAERTGDTSFASVTRLQPLRVLVVTHDEHFGRVTAFLLGARGYDVRQIASGGRAVDDAARERADVVVIEAGRSRATAARAVAALQALANAPALLIVAAGDAQWAASGLPTIAKWSPIEAVMSAIDNAALRRTLPLS
jgi:CheY-like chemotaxis protein